MQSATLTALFSTEVLEPDSKTATPPQSSVSKNFLLYCHVHGFKTLLAYIVNYVSVKVLKVSKYHIYVQEMKT
jgi:hypothetical protein